MLITWHYMYKAGQFNFLKRFTWQTHPFVIPIFSLVVLLLNCDVNTYIIIKVDLGKYWFYLAYHWVFSDFIKIIKIRSFRFSITERTKLLAWLIWLHLYKNGSDKIYTFAQIHIISTDLGESNIKTLSILDGIPTDFLYQEIILTNILEHLIIVTNFGHNCQFNCGLCDLTFTCQTNNPISV
jgi:hypothetical protein